MNRRGEKRNTSHVVEAILILLGETGGVQSKEARDTGSPGSEPSPFLTNPPIATRDRL